MNDITDRHHTFSELVFQGAPSHPLDMYCNDTVITAVKQWQLRKPITEPMPELLRLENTRSFVISCEGECRDYWPSQKDNLIGETLIREFLFAHGICQLNSLEPRFYTAHYEVIAMQETEFMLVLPFPTESNNIAGVLVVCVNRQLRKGAPFS